MASVFPDDKRDFPTLQLSITYLNMVDRLPPLTALRAFDAAARHMSFAKAADELNVTPAALSFQIKSLEDHLGQPVFRRLNRAVELTDAGSALAPGAREAFEVLTQAWRSTLRQVDTSVIRLTAGPAFTAKWLAPRMFEFATEHPEIEIRFAATLRLLDLDRDDIDVAIRFGFGPDDGFHSRLLLREWATPMMSPALAEKYATPDSLKNAILLHQDDTAWLDPPMDWEAWFEAEDIGPLPKGGPRFSQADHALDVALAGGGVVLGRASLAAKDLKDGRLVAPFNTALSTEATYRVLCAEGAENRPHIAAFLNWLEASAANVEELSKGRRMVSPPRRT